MVRSGSSNECGFVLPFSASVLCGTSVSKPVTTPSTVARVLSISTFDYSDVTGVFIFPPTLSRAVFFSLSVTLGCSCPRFMSSAVVLSNLRRDS